ncbi:hypothetical protein [Prosthecobacter dejongeii]|uniref:Uncharacterized protein n=1 Tax=Prosthecobacter dejongeii TaxID=48465 RepID=A0A7W7YQR1_9BACT|nr:hypothetical protein [Prosthecobacter dejongeii]MBB5040600.1 hypothetical protein [Prosthecobacter dejongeii]
MNACLAYTVRILYRFNGAEAKHVYEMHVTAKDETEAKRAARLVWIDTTPAGQGVQWLGSSAEVDNGQMHLL